MTTNKYAIPRANAPFSESGAAPTREWYNYLNGLDSDTASNNADLLNDIEIISVKLGSPDGTPENIPPIDVGGQVRGNLSILSQGVLPGIVTLNLEGDVGEPGNTYYYGTNGTGVKSFYSVASAFLGTTDNITLTVGSNGVTTVSIASTYPGQTSITTLGTIMTGTWHGTIIDAPHGGTGHGVYAVGDLLYADTTSSLARVAATTNGDVLTLVAGLPVWAPAAAGGITSITAGTGLAATPSNPITTSGTLSLANRGASTIMGNPTASAATPTDITIGTGLSLSVGGVLSATSVSPTQTITASENITAPAMVHIHTTGGTTTVRNASAVSSARPARGFILTSVTTGNPAAVYGPGQVITGFPAATLTGDNVYLATTSAGAPSNTPALASGNLLQRVGTPISDTAFIFDPDDGIVMP